MSTEFVIHDDQDKATDGEVDMATKCVIHETATEEYGSISATEIAMIVLGSVGGTLVVVILAYIFFRSRVCVDRSDAAKDEAEKGQTFIG